MRQSLTAFRLTGLMRYQPGFSGFKRGPLGLSLLSLMKKLDSHPFSAFGSRRERRCLCSITTDRHAAPPPPVSMALIEKEQRAFDTFAGFDVPEVGRTDESCNLFSKQGKQ